MEETGNSTILDFDSPKEQSSYIKVIGVGGGGGNAVNNMYAQGIKGVDFIICNTDMKALNSSPVPKKIVLGSLGAGNIPTVAHDAAMQHKDEIRAAIEENTQMLFITAGMGGGTGTGAAPVIAEIAKDVQLQDPNVPHILVVAVVTVPFSFEGRRRRQQADEGIAELRKHVDSILIINNDKLRELGNLQLSQAFKQADNVLFTAVKGIAEIITVSDYINIDFHDVNTVMQNSGTALMGTGIGKGEERAMDAIQEASRSVLLNDNDIAGAKNVLLYFSYPPNKELTMDEMEDVTTFITQLTGRDVADVIWGAGTDDSLDEEIKITLIATGFETRKDQKPRRIPLEEASKTVNTTTDAGQSSDHTPVNDAKDEDSGMVVIHRDSPEADETMQPAAETKTTIHRYSLDGGIIDNSHADQAPAPTAPAQHSTEVYDDGINMVHRSQEEAAAATQQAATIAAPAMAPKAEQPYTAPMVTAVEPTALPTALNEANAPQPATSMPFGNSQSAVMARAERMNRAKRLNELLHKDPNGPHKIDAMTTEELTNEEIYHAPHSSESDATKVTMNSDGTITQRNPYVFDRPD